jgi:hypothetical protein
MLCPECQQPMSKGFAEFQGSVDDRLFLRAAPVTLNFAATETFEFELLRPSERTVARRAVFSELSLRGRWQ